MKTITLATGEQALVDDEDFERLCVFKWSLLKSHAADKQGYAKRGVWISETKKVKTVFMHHDVLNLPPSVRVDHKNGKKLNNQKANLRPATVTQNAGNSPWRNTPGRTSKFKGVCWHRRQKRWYAQIMQTKNGVSKPKCLGYFVDEVDAARVYNAAAISYFGSYALLNPV